MSMADLTLLRPFWLLAPPLLLLMAFRASARGQPGDWRRAIDPHLFAVLEQRGAVQGEGGRRGVSSWLAAAALIAVALAGPAIERIDPNTFRNLDGVVLALHAPGRNRSATEARLAMWQLAEAAGARQVALVVYAGDAYLAAPFSADRAALRPLLSADAADLVPDAGSAPGRGLILATALFERAGMIGGDVVLVTDGQGIAPPMLEAATRLATSQRRLHVLLAGLDGSTNEDTARELARAGSGSFADAGTPGAVVRAVAENPLRRLGAAGYGALIWSDLGRYLLVLAAVPLLLAFRRRA